MAQEFWRGRSVLVTGANGFIGAWVIRTLADLGANVTGYDKSEIGALSLHDGVRDRIELVLGDLTDQALLERTLVHRDVKTVIHLGAQSNISFAAGGPVPAFESNIRGTWTVLDACRSTAHPETIVIASSNTVYGEHETAPFDETYALNANNPYSSSKACADILARCYAASFNLPVAVARATNTYGGADPNLMRIVPDTLLRIIRGERPAIRSDGSPAKGYLYIKDTVSAYITLGERAAEEGIRGNAFNFHPDAPTTVLELVQTMVKVAGRPDLEPEVLNETTNREYEFLSNKRAADVLGWRPAYTLEQGLAETFEWYKQHEGSELERAARVFSRPS
jgi:CDP-glucose 4,6-dehydratase